MNEKNLTRRQFLAASGLMLAGAAVSTTGCAPQTTQSTPTAPVETPSFTFETDTTMNERILVAYATRTGSTVGVAEALGQTLNERGYAVDVKPIQDNPDLGAYQKVILGSAVNGAQWLPEAVDYVKNHQEALQQVPVALFCVHIMNLGDSESSQKKRQAYLDAVRPLVNPVTEAFFAGVGMNPAETPAFVRWFYRAFKIGGEGDCRDWDVIRAWAKTVSL